MISSMFVVDRKDLGERVWNLMPSSEELGLMALTAVGRHRKRQRATHII